MVIESRFRCREILRTSPCRPWQPRISGMIRTPRVPKRFGLLALLLLANPGVVSFLEAQRPNFVVIFTDDQGYNDLGCQGSPLLRTPRIDRMAEEGTRFTSFYAQVVCGPSRAALLTGCYPIRAAEPDNRKNPHTILHPREITIAEMLKQAGYATGIFGKWHLAGNGGRKHGPGTGPWPKELMPNSQGFDRFFGTPAHNGFTRTLDLKRFITELLGDEELVERPTDMDRLTERTTDEAISWIKQNSERPFFAYIPFNMVHVVLGASSRFKGRSERGIYGDAIEELDHSVGRILDAIEELGLDERTLVLFTSDNGPWIEENIGDHGGSAAPLRGFKMNTWEGGCRVPAIVRWPGVIPKDRVSDEIVTTLDLFPTFARLAGASLPEDRSIDGHDMTSFWQGKADKSPRDSFFYYAFTHLQAVRKGDWKLVLPRPARPPWTSWYGRMIDEVKAPELYDLREDIGEQHDVAAAHPEVVARLTALVEQVRGDLGDHDRIGKGARFFDDGPRRPKMTKRPSSSSGHDGFEPLGSLHFDFEAGNLQGWRVEQGAFAQPVSSAVSLPRWKEKPFCRHGGFHLSTAATATDKGASDKQAGVMVSPLFELLGDRASFLVGGGQAPLTYVALCDEKGEELIRAGGAKGPQMVRRHWDVSAWRGRKLFLRVVDRSKAGWGHITFDDFSCEGRLVR